jgi:hypothetical protein
MLGILDAINPELMKVQQDERLAGIRSEYRRHELLALAGYVDPADRCRALVAAWLLRLAVRLDGRVASRAAGAAAGLSARAA